MRTPRFTLGVPTLVRYDLLEKFLQSLRDSEVKPEQVIIVDNGEQGDFFKHIVEVGSPIHVVKPRKNLGVAASWNEIVARSRILYPDHETVVFANDDVILGRLTLTQYMWQVARGMDLVESDRGSDGFCLFALSRRCVDIVGLFDELFWPAYYEDCDFSIRFDNACRRGQSLKRGKAPAPRHEGWATTKALGSEGWIGECRQANAQHYARKWGGPPPEPCWGGSWEPRHLEAFGGREELRAAYEEDQRKTLAKFENMRAKR